MIVSVFETIHPFLDGNGRIGRLLITLGLIDKQILKYPVLYISYYLKRNRVEYYDRLMDVRFKGHFEEWLRFFLNGLIASAEDACETIRVLTRLHEDNLDRIMALPGRKENLIKLLFYIERNPIIDIAKTAQALELQYNTVAKAVDRLVGLGILFPANTYKRNRRFVYTEYLDNLKKDT